jgi:gamma-glutamylcyclotransferase (GGCT)/AIG2-like uncharacterized protein YtfP
MANPRPITPLFVYGTLKKGYRLHRFLEGARFLGDAQLKGFNMYNLGSYPGIVRDEAAGTVSGEIYDVDAPTLRRLDYVEGGYERQLHVTTDGKWVNVYVYPRTEGEKVADGVWK